MKLWIYAAVISFRQSKTQNRLFAKKKPSSMRFMLALAMSSFLMMADVHYHYLTYLRGAISLLVAPLQLTVDYPVSVFSWAQNLVSSKKALVNENMKLRYEQSMLEAQLQKLLLIRHENSRLKELLLASSHSNMQAMAAQILAVDTTSSRQLHIINKGMRDGVFIGQPVLDAKGVMGQVIHVGAMTSSVLLITDSKSGIPVQNNRTGERGILVGTNNVSQLSLMHLPKTSPIADGDILVTSGLGRRYPEGYPVGRVKTITKVPGDEFMHVEVTPVALLNRNRLVLLIWPEKEHEELTKEISAQLHAQHPRASA